MYFKSFPLTYYSVDDGANVKVVTNITLRAVINDEVKNNLSLFDEYDIKDGETPEIVSDKFYGSSFYHWIILHTNDILDARYEWPLSNRNLIAYCNDKYTNPGATHHYENSDGIIVNSSTPGATPISNFMYEDRLNESKRRIKVLKPQYVSLIVDDFTKKLQA